MLVDRLVHETDLVTSVYLRPSDSAALPTPSPGQYVTVRLAGPGIPVAVRSYSLSAATPDRYRISVKRETHGIASEYIATTLAVGDEVDIAAPRGEFVLDDGDNPVVLLSAGIGVTPVLAMLQALVAQHSTRIVWWLHTSQTPATDALDGEARMLIESLPFGHRHVHYTADAGHGRLDESALATLGLPTDASAYVCGPVGFMDAMTLALVNLGVSGDRIHTERFGSLTAINPGVVGADRPVPHLPVAIGDGPLVTFARAGIAAAFDHAVASLLEMAEACDIPTRWSCRTGVCHTCATPLLSGTVGYEPSPLTEPEPGEALLCCSTPRTDVVLDL
jgi:ferredoxin-NADP reductase/ferredoxin